MSTELIYGESKSFKSMLDKLDDYAPNQWPILLLGETGVGKELLARRVHDLSNRKQMNFVPVNCSAIPAGLFESEIFGFERGAFSGAIQSSRGLARMANGGTLFLDEIGELDLSLQAKLLRLIDSGEVRAVGSQKVEYVNIKVIAATNVDLYAAVAAGAFRQDLLERLSVLRVQIPPLRERREDIPMIAKGILERLGARFSEESLPSLSNFPWPGNVRQMRNILIRATVLGRMKVSGELLQKLLHEEEVHTAVVSVSHDASLLDGALEDIEKQVIVDRLKKHHGNRKETAKDLGIAKSTLHEKLRRWKKDPEVAQHWPMARWGHTVSL